MVSTRKIIPFISGTFMSINFVVFWAIPIMGMGLLWKFALKPVLLPLYNAMDQNKILRSFAENFIYTNPKHADYFATSILATFGSLSTLAFVFRWFFVHGSLPWWLIFAYYCSWVGIGGRMMGAAYALAHKEAHTLTFYKKYLRPIMGNFFENVLGVFFGNVPHNFTTSHIGIHHKTNGGLGDTFYLWDLDRTSLFDFMLYIHRIFLHMIGYTSIKLFRLQKSNKADLLLSGVYKYCAVALLIVVVTRSFSFLFWIYIQPLFCMSYFLALLNIGYHGFLEVDPQTGSRISVVDASTIIEGEDDYFGEDDHMAHHYQSNVYFRDLPALQKTKEGDFKKYHASVFRGLSIVELSIFILLNIWDKLAEHYVDYTKSMSKEEIILLLKTRLQRKEMSYEDYETRILNPIDTEDALLAIAHQTLDPSKNLRRTDDDESDRIANEPEQTTSISSKKSD